MNLKIMSTNNQTNEFLQKLAPCIERGELEKCVEEAMVVINLVLKNHEPQMNADERRLDNVLFLDFRDNSKRVT